MSTVITAITVALVSWVALSFFGKPILTLGEKRREALEVGERCAFVGLHIQPMLIMDDGLADLRSDSDEQKNALRELQNSGNSLRAYFRERSLATRIYCWVFGYDLDYAARALLGLGEAARSQYDIDESARRLTLHALFVALGATHHLSAGEIVAARTEMAQWHSGNREFTTPSARVDDA